MGLVFPNLKLYPATAQNPNLRDTGRYAIFEGRKRYELTNHLGNVLAVITDRKRGQAQSGTTIQWYNADVVSAQQYYPFGMLMPDTSDTMLRRQYSLNGNDYRYGFNGKEGDDEVKGDDNQLDYGMRIYDPRVGRFLSTDPIAKAYPMLTPYQFASNTPIQAIDLDGNEAVRYSGTILKTPAGKILNTIEINTIPNSAGYGEDGVLSEYWDEETSTNIKQYFPLNPVFTTSVQRNASQQGERVFNKILNVPIGVAKKVDETMLNANATAYGISGRASIGGFDFSVKLERYFHNGKGYTLGGFDISYNPNVSLSKRMVAGTSILKTIDLLRNFSSAKPDFSADLYWGAYTENSPKPGGVLDRFKVTKEGSITAAGFKTTASSTGFYKAGVSVSTGWQSLLDLHPDVKAGVKISIISGSYSNEGKLENK